MSKERDGKEMRKRDAVEALETVEIRGQAATTREQVNDGGNAQEREHGQGGAEEDEQDGREEQGAALAVLLGQMVAYLSSKIDVNDLDIVSFSLHHLFCGFDSLYRVLLPSFVVSLASEAGEEMDAYDGQSRPLTWLQLQALRQVVRRMRLLCDLLSEDGESVLGQLGYRESRENEESRESEESKGSEANKTASMHEEYSDEPLARADRHRTGEQAESEQDILYVAASAGVEQALQDLAATLIRWQQGYRNLPSFRSLLYALFPTIPLPLQPGAPFTQLLDCAITLFGDILPAFHVLAVGDDEAVILLLFDLLQQVDLLAVECETLLELFHLLLQQHLVAVI